MITIHKITEQKPEPWFYEYVIKLLETKNPTETNAAREIIRRDQLRREGRNGKAEI